MQELVKQILITNQPVDDAIPERLPQAKPTMTAESSGLLPPNKNHSLNIRRPLKNT